MNKNTSLLSITMTILLSSTMAFTAENNNNRYNEIVAALANLSENFVFQSSDIQVVEEHKAALQKELDSYKNSWTPALLKVLGTGFGLETTALLAITTIKGIATFVAKNENDKDILFDRTHHIRSAIKTIEGFTYPLSYFAAKTIQYPYNTLTGLYGKLDIPYNKNLANYTMFAVITGTTLGFGLITKYLFNKANSYKTEIARLEEEIKTDDAIITALQNQ